MSYEIFYNKQFIKAEKNGETVFFPIVYAGSNNCYEVSYNRKRNGRRSRSWYNFSFYTNNKHYGTLKEILENIENYKVKLIEDNKNQNLKYIEEGHEDWVTEYSDNLYGFFTATSFGGGCKVTYKQFQNMFINGAKRSMTVEELKDFGVATIIETRIWDDDAKNKLKQSGKTLLSFYPKTSQELISNIDECLSYYNDMPYVSIYISINASEHTMKNISKKFCVAKSQKIFQDVNGYYIINIEGCGVFYNSKKHGFRYTPYKTSGKPFASLKNANNFIKKLSERFPLQKFNAEFVDRTIRMKI